jgi:hypothetical protein
MFWGRKGRRVRRVVAVWRGCHLLGRAEGVIAPTALPTAMESALGVSPGGSPPPELGPRRRRV